jgi:hypothetical protein
VGVFFRGMFVDLRLGAYKTRWIMNSKRGNGMGINRWSDVEQRKRRETEAKAGEEIPKKEKGDASSRLQASEGPAEDEEKRAVVEKLRKLESDS